MGRRLVLLFLKDCPIRVNVVYVNYQPRLSPLPTIPLTILLNV